MITFFFYKKGIGGVQNLYLNLIKELARKGITVKLIYFKDSWLTNELDKFKIDYKFFDLGKNNSEDIGSFVTSEDILIDTGFGGSLFRFYKIDPYFFFWNVYPGALGTKAKNPIRKILLRRIIARMQRNYGLFFMDDSGVNNIKEVYNLDQNIHYLPVPIEISQEGNALPSSYFREKISEESIPLSYIGRAELWKVVPVKKILSRLEDIAGENNRKFHFHIITDNKEEFQKLLEITSSDKVYIEYHTGLYGEKLRDFLSHKILINFSMGSSCLESAATGIPTIILDFYSFSTKVSNSIGKYRWLHETSNFNLGNLIEEGQETSGHDLSAIFAELSEDYLKDISHKCYSYVCDNHSLEVVADNFLRYTNLCRNKLKPCLRYSVSYLKYEPSFSLFTKVYYTFRKKTEFSD
jgi:hypothetical protein